MAMTQQTTTGLRSFAASPTISTTNLTRARDFYTKTLGLKEIDFQDGITMTLEAGRGTTLVVYQRQDAPKAENTALTFSVRDIETLVNGLRSAGVKFEEFDEPKTTNGVATMDSHKAAWFKDPDGNILCLHQDQ